MIETPGDATPPPPPPQIPPMPPMPPGGWHAVAGPTRPSQGMAIAALILAFIPLGLTGLVAVGLGIAVLAKSRGDRPNHGKVKAWIAIPVGLVLGLVFSTAIVVGVVEAIHDENRLPQHTSSPSTSGDWVNVATLVRGDCFNADSFRGSKEAVTVRSVELVPCTTAHEWQVYAEAKLPEHIAEADVSDTSRDICDARLDPNIVPERATADLTYIWLFPLPHQLAAGQRQVQCIAGLDHGHKTTGSWLLEHPGAVPPAKSTGPTTQT